MTAVPGSRTISSSGTPGGDTPSERSPQQSLVAVYVCVLQRFLVVALMFFLGLGVWKLDPLAVLAGFITGQIILIISGSKQLTQK